MEGYPTWVGICIRSEIGLEETGHPHPRGIHLGGGSGDTTNMPFVGLIYQDNDRTYGVSGRKMHFRTPQDTLPNLPILERVRNQPGCI